MMIGPDVVREFIIENFLFGERERFDSELSFMKSGVVDSMGMLELVDFLEKNYGIRIHDEEFIPDNLDNMIKIDRFLRRKLNGTPGGPPVGIPLRKG